MIDMSINNMKLNDMVFGEFLRRKQCVPAKGTKCFSKGNTLKSLFLLIVMMVVGVNGTWGQSEGVYYIANHANSTNTTPPYSYDKEAPANNYYLVPAKDPQLEDCCDAYFSEEYNLSNEKIGDPERPYLTTFQTNKDVNSAWVIKSAGNNMFFLIHVKTGKYAFYQTAPDCGNNYKHRKVIHLEDLSNLANIDNAKFYIENPVNANGSTSYTFRPQSLSTSNRFFNPTGGNKPVYYGSYQGATGNCNNLGLVGVYSSKDDVGSKWYLESALLPAPTIDYDLGADKFTISYDLIAKPEGFKILYTTDGSDPTINTTNEYTSGSEIKPSNIGTNPLKAVVACYGMILSKTASIRTPSEPVITPTSGDCRNTVTITAGDFPVYYTLNGSDPDKSSTLYSEPFVLNENATIKAIAYDNNLPSGITTYDYSPNYTSIPTITQNGATITITGTGSIYYTTNGSEPSTGSTPYTNPFTLTGNSGDQITIRAVAKDGTKGLSCVAEKTVTMAYYISDLAGLEAISSHPSDVCILMADINASGLSASISDFTGEFDGGFHTISGLTKPLFSNINGGKVKNVILDGVGISGGTDAGAIANVVTGDSRIYNCGILSGTVSGSGNVGSLVGLLDGTSRVINCYSYATVSGGSTMGGIVGNNSQTSTMNDIKTIVVNCMFYGDITGGSNISPVYGGNLIDNAGETGINNYNYYRRNRYDRETDTYVDDVTFDDNNFALDKYHRSWPADAKYLTRFEYYRSILNSNKRLCTWWVNGTNGTAPTDADVANVGIAKWVLDPSIAPYPILKPWGKYPSVINQDPDKRIDPSTNAWVNRGNASDNWGKDMVPDTLGQKLGTVTVTINGGTYHSGSASKTINITAMDKEHNDYCYGKIQLPYYNEIFGNPNGDTWEAKYGGNYTAHVVTGWDVSGGSAATNYNFADRNSYSGRVFAQGGYFYVPKNVTSITITAHWADAVYLCNKDRSIDRVNVAAGGKKNQNDNSANAPKKIPEYGSPFTPAGTIPTTFQGQTVYTTIQDAIGALSTTSNGKDVYNQAIVLVGNVQLRNHSSVYGATEDNTRPFTIMSADLDFDNEPDYCLELQFRNDIDRPGVQPIRFDFLPVPELGLAIRTNKLAYAIGLMIPLGHFEITETAFMHTTQFEYDANVTRKGKSPVIINGGEHEMFTVRYHASNRTSYFLLGGNAWIHRFAPGAHPNTGQSPAIYLCPINVIGGEIKELYLSGLYRPALSAPNDQGNPYCYIDGGKFDIVAGAGYEKVAGNVTFKIDHSLIDEFYGGGINGTNPIGGNIDVIINNSRVDKYCGGPKVGDMTGKTVTTSAKGTTFGVFYGGGNGGNTYYRQLQRDGDMGSDHIDDWSDEKYNWDWFSPLLTWYDDGSESEANYTEEQNKTRKVYNKGYHAEYEFEVFNQSNGLSDEITQRGFIHWIQFGITKTGAVENTLENCRVKQNFYGGGNLASVEVASTSETPAVKTTLKGSTIVEGNVYGAGYSAEIPKFQVHNRDSKVFPSMDDAGVITDGYIPYAPTVYEWTNKLNGKTENERKADPTYSITENGETKWYCYTWNSLENLGAVIGNVELNIEGNTVVKGLTDIGKDTEAQTGGVFGGGDASAVTGNIEVKIDASGQKEGFSYNVYNVFGGGNEAAVTGNAKVTLKGKSIIDGNVFGGGNEGAVSGSTEVNIEE